ncbi:MAG: hypothetical protein ACXAEN_23960 [Candidatus Thorarchaeota archaeon]|jgi:hypothetical protein
MAIATMFQLDALSTQTTTVSLEFVEIVGDVTWCINSDIPPVVPVGELERQSDALA